MAGNLKCQEDREELDLFRYLGEGFASINDRNRNQCPVSLALGF
jgi:hypothetical protein